MIGVVAISITKPIQMEWTETGAETGTALSMTITAYKDGSPVGEPLILAGFERGGLEIDSFVVVVSWNSTGSANIDWSTFDLTGSMRVSYLNKYDKYIKEYETSITSAEPSSTWTKTLVLGTDVCKMENFIYGGWFLEWTGSITGTVDTTEGVPLTDTFTLPTGTVWIEYVTEYKLESDWDY